MLKLIITTITICCLFILVQQFFIILLGKIGALCILWSGVMEWSLGLESWSGVLSGFLEWNIGVKF